MTHLKRVIKNMFLRRTFFICIESTLFFTKPGMDVVYFKHMISSLAILSQLN